MPQFIQDQFADIMRGVSASNTFSAVLVLIVVLPLLAWVRSAYNLACKSKH